MPNSGIVPWIGGRIRRGVAPKVMRTTFLQDQRQAERRDDRQRGYATDRLDHDALDQRAEQEADQRRDDETEPEIAGRLQREPGQHGADHEEVAMRDIDDVEKAEDDDKAERDQRDDQAPDQPVQRQQAAACPS